MTFTKYGDLVLQLVVPFDFKELAVPLSNAFGLPLHIDVQLWKPFTDAVAAEAAEGATG